jgi:hypothetical protein
MEYEFNRVFKNNLKITTRSVSVKTLLSERNLSRINYKPYYQRNYVWDNSKATFFIESVLLGTDIPPLIFFKSGNSIEVIDGRQRFETLKRFKENSFKLSISGLMELKVLKDKGFNDLDESIKAEFLETKVRLFEFEVINEPKLSEELEDRVKKEIFRRYNTGITPINSVELDNAKYDDDELTKIIKDELKECADFYTDVANCFFSNKTNSRPVDTFEVTDFIRRYITLSHFPIISYAGSGSRTEIRELLYEFIVENIEDATVFFNEFKDSLKKVVDIHKVIGSEANLNNKLIYECLLWGVNVLSQDGIDVVISSSFLNEILIHYSDNISNYSMDDSHHYVNIVKRFNDTAAFLGKKYTLDLGLYIKDESFSGRIKKLKQTEEDGLIKINVLKGLRCLKPEPSSEPIEEVISDLSTKKYMLRPSYQRKERISILKASSIIESILLGIYLPPIFVFKNSDNIKEVVDGQQRLLAIIAFLGKTYMDERGVQNHSIINSFSLKGLNILKELNGKKSSDLPDGMIGKIYDFDLNIIEIDSKLNKDFVPVDLFIRLNNKPYPIKEHSFEMWNSTVTNDLIKKIKDLTEINIDWFYLRPVKEDRVSDRMGNEEMLTVLSYLEYLKATSDGGGVEYYLKQDRLNSRISNKAGISTFLNGLDVDIKKKEEFFKCINRVESFIYKLKLLLVERDNLADGLNSILNVKSASNFKRSLQEIYFLWMIIRSIDETQIISGKNIIIEEIVDLLKVMKNVAGEVVDTNYMDSFNIKMTDLIANYAH